MPASPGNGNARGYQDLDAQLPYQQFEPQSQAPAAAPLQNVAIGAEAGSAKQSIWSVDYWAGYFNVDTNQVLHRIQSSFFPYGSFFDLIEGNPDLWGPFWIPATLVVVIFAANYLATAISTTETLSYDFTRLTAAALVICLYGTVVPALIYLACRRWKVGLSLIEILSVYGYSWSIWVPVAVICIAPFSLVRWITIMVAAGVSGLFISRNLIALVSKQTDKKNATLVGLFVLACHFALALMYKFMFFHQ